MRAGGRCWWASGWLLRMMPGGRPGEFWPEAEGCGEPRLEAAERGMTCADGGASGGPPFWASCGWPFAAAEARSLVVGGGRVGGAVALGAKGWSIGALVDLVSEDGVKELGVTVTAR